MISKSFVRFFCHYVIEVLGSHVSIAITICCSEHLLYLLIAYIFPNAPYGIFEVVNAEFSCAFGVECGENQISLRLSVLLVEFSSCNSNEFCKIEL